MIRIIYLKDERDALGTKGVYAPCFVCSACGKVIEGDGNYCYDATRLDGIAVRAACKGPCTDALERGIMAHPDGDAVFHWNNLSDLLDNLRTNMTKPLGQVLNP